MMLQRFGNLKKLKKVALSAAWQGVRRIKGIPMYICYPPTYFFFCFW